MDQARRLRGLLDRPHHPGRGERRFVDVRAGPAGGALDAGRQLVGIGEQQQRLAADAHRADRDRSAGRRRRGRPAASSDSRRRRRRGRGVRAQAASTGRRPRRRRRARRRRRKARERRRERGGRGARAGQVSGLAARRQSVRRANDISGFGAILRAGARRQRPTLAPRARGRRRRRDVRGPHDSLRGAWGRSGAAQQRGRRPNRPGRRRFRSRWFVFSGLRDNFPPPRRAARASLASRCRPTEGLSQLLP